MVESKLLECVQHKQEESQNLRVTVWDCHVMGSIMWLFSRKAWQSCSEYLNHLRDVPKQIYGDGFCSHISTPGILFHQSKCLEMKPLRTEVTWKIWWIFKKNSLKFENQILKSKQLDVWVSGIISSRLKFNWLLRIFYWWFHLRSFCWLLSLIERRNRNVSCCWGGIETTKGKSRSYDIIIGVDTWHASRCVNDLLSWICWLQN